MLSPQEYDWLAEEGQETFGLTAPRARVLLAVLRHEHFTLREIGREVGLSPDSVAAALELLMAREILEVRRTDSHRGQKSGGHPEKMAVPGRRLRFVLSAVPHP